MAKMKLYYSPSSPYARKVRLNDTDIPSMAGA